MLTGSLSVLRFFALLSQRLRWARSRKWIMTPALSFWAKWWQAAKSLVLASGMRRCDIARLTHAWLARLCFLFLGFTLETMDGNCSTAKCRVFDTKKPGWTQKCSVRHKNALPSIHQLTLPLSNTPLSVKNMFFQFYSNILFLRSHREMRMKLYWCKFKYIQYHYEIWNVILFSVCDDYNVCSYK